MVHQDNSQTVSQKLRYSLADQEYCSVPQGLSQLELNWCMIMVVEAYHGENNRFGIF